MAKYSNRIMKKEFSNTDSKKAYLNACKWYANNVVNNDDIAKKCSCSIIRSYNNETGIYTFVLELNINIDEKEIKGKHCRVCKETHSTLFKCEETNCNWCKINAFDRRLEDTLKAIGKYVKAIIKEKM